jgi:hypothetical protein
MSAKEHRHPPLLPLSSTDSERDLVNEQMACPRTGVTAHDDPGRPLQFDCLEVILDHPSISYLRSITEKVPNGPPSIDPSLVYIFDLIAYRAVDTPLFIRLSRAA